MNSKYEVIRQFVAAHGGRAELIEHETAIEDSYHTLAIDPRLVVECNAIAGCFNGEDSSSRCDSRTEADVQLLNHLTISPGLLFSTIMAGAGRTIDMMGGKV